MAQPSDQLLGAVIGASSQDMDDEVIVTATTATTATIENIYEYASHP